MRRTYWFDPYFVVPNLLMGTLILVIAATVWLMLWIWFRRSMPLAPLWGLTGAALGSVLIASFVKVLAAHEVHWDGLTVEVPVPYQLLVMVGPLMTQYAWFSLALCLARRHGYRWVRIDDARPVPPRCERPSESLTAGSS